jgi:FHS family L-fucose permease-like MFS transporter
MAGSLPAPLAPATAAPKAGQETNYTAPLAVLTTLFFMWGFLTCLNDILSPHLKALFDLNYYAAGFVQTAFFFAYFVMSLPAGWIVKRTGYKRGIIIGLGVAALGCLLFYPAAKAQAFPLFLVALFVLGSGITLLQVAANPFVAVLGKPETASSRLTLTQAFNSLGTTIAPHFGALVILAVAVKSADELKKMTPAAVETYRAVQASAVQTPYLGLALTLVALGVAIGLSRLPTIDEGSDGAVRAVGDESRKSAWEYRHLVLGAVGIFVYVGAEVAIGNYLVSYFKEPYMGGLPEAAGAEMVKWYWGAAMAGRFVGTLTLRFFRPGKLLSVHALGAVLLTAVTMTTTGSIAMWTILAVGFFNSIMFPTIFTLAIEGLGRHTRQGSGILCMAIVGGAIIPPLTGKIADKFGLHHCFVLAAACYLYIAWYGMKGHIAKAHAA